MPDVPPGEKFFFFGSYKGQFIPQGRLDDCLNDINESGVVRVEGTNIYPVNGNDRKRNTSIGMIIKHREDGSGSVSYHYVDEGDEETDEQATLRKILENY